jgi:nitroreductase
MTTFPSITSTIRQRFSCRSYTNNPISPDIQAELENWIQNIPPGPFGSSGRFKLVAITAADRGALHKLGTYGFIKGAPGYIIATCRDTGRGLEDFGYQMEQIILKATALRLGTCWLGGTFTRSSFARLIAATPDEIIPAVCAVGEIAGHPRVFDGLVRQFASSAERLGWERLFYDGDFGVPLTLQAAAEYATPLEMVRLAPSASNKQPWRVVKAGTAWHFYLQRTPNYRIGWANRLLGVADLQRTDLGIAACHFELSAAEAKLPGRWQVLSPTLALPDKLTEYVISWGH